MEHTHKTTRTGVHWVYAGDITKELAGFLSSGGSYIFAARILYRSYRARSRGTIVRIHFYLVQIESLQMLRWKARPPVQGGTQGKNTSGWILYILQRSLKLQ